MFCSSIATRQPPPRRNSYFGKKRLLLLLLLCDAALYQEALFCSLVLTRHNRKRQRGVIECLDPGILNTFSRFRDVFWLGFLTFSFVMEIIWFRVIFGRLLRLVSVWCWILCLGNVWNWEYHRWLVGSTLTCRYIRRRHVVGESHY